MEKFLKFFFFFFFSSFFFQLIEVQDKVETPSILFRLNPDFTIRHVSGRCTALLGLTKREMVSLPFTSHLDLADQDLPALLASLSFS